MIDNQLGRRNLSGGQRDYLIGQRYSLEKQRVGGNRGNQYTKVVSGQNDHMAERTEATLADQYRLPLRIRENLYGGVTLVLSMRRALSLTSAANGLMRRCFLRWQSER